MTTERSSRIRIKARDRIGMALDILKIIFEFGINLKAVEVEPGLMWIKMDQDSRVDQNLLMDRLLIEEDVEEVQLIDFLPQEQREKHIEAVLDATREGIISIDNKGIITTFNSGAEKTLKIKSQEVIGKHIADILSPDLPMLKTIKTGESYDNIEIVLNLDNAKCHYLTSGRPILDERGCPISAVATVLDMENVMELVYSFTRPSMITFDEIVGKSEKMKKIKDFARFIAKGYSTILIRGESGTGKELFARSIHMASLRKDKPFVPVNCAALPETLLESELFGYDEGAFTGAKKGGRQGLFKFADKGTIFLDEIGELSPNLQAKLLRVLQEGKIRKIGSDEEIAVDVRVIAASNRNLEELMKTGRFRNDLYYRLNVIPLYIPPLRERREDIPVLVEHFIEKFAQRMNKTIPGIHEKAAEKLLNYNWPGNVRELSNVLERALNLCEQVIQPEHLFLGEEGEMYFSIKGHEETQINNNLKEIVQAAEKKAIIEALDKHKSIRRAAKCLQVSHVTLLNKIKLYGLKTKEHISPINPSK
ncbi:MAG: sigma 54-interacting transcriptional regulator [Bacillota bacterium]